MAQLEFRKFKDEFGDESLIIFAWGKYQMPIAILDKYDIKKMKHTLEG